MCLMKSILIFLLLLAVQTPSGSVNAGRGVILAKCEQLFGQRVEETPILFSVDRFYVLRVQFSEDGQLEQASVVPRYYYADTHPDWEEPDNFEWLSTARVADMLAKIERLRPIGKL